MFDYFNVNYTGNPFQLFGIPHLVTLLVVIVGLLLLLRWLKTLSTEGKKRFRYILAATLVVCEIIWQVLFAIKGQWSVKIHLPLHLCAVMAYLSAAMLITRNKRLYEFIYFPGMCGAIQAVFTPSLENFGFPHFLYFQTFIIHGAIILAALYMTIVEKYRPRPASFIRVIIGMNIYMLIIGGVNRLLGSNYMFIAHKPDFPSLLDVLGPWPLYILSLEAVGLFAFFLVYLPFLIIDLRKSTTEK